MHMRSLNQLNRLSVRTKLIFMLLVVSLCSMFASTFICSRTGEALLTERVYSQLTSFQHLKSAQIQNYFKILQAHTQTLSDDQMFVDAMKEFKDAYDKLAQANVPAAYDEKLEAYYRNEFVPRLKKTIEGDPLVNTFVPKSTTARYLQYHYTANSPFQVGEKFQLDDAKDGSNYSRVHARYHPKFRNIIKSFGYYDMFLIDKTGTVVYTLSKEVDFAADLPQGPYAQSNLVAAFEDTRRANSKTYVKIVDFQPYQPSYDAPAAFIASPIFDGSEMVGVLAFQLPTDRVNAIMTGDGKWEADGLGKTGEAYLLGQDRLMRSVSRFLVQDPIGYTKTLRERGIPEKTINKINQFKTSIFLQEIRTQAAERALSGKEGTLRYNDYRGVDVLSSYAPVEIDSLRWAMVAKMDTAEAFAPISTFQRNVVIAAALIVVLVTLVAMWLARLFVRPIERTIASTKRLESGDGNTLVTSGTQDEFGDLARSFNEKVYALRSHIRQVEQQNAENQSLIDLLLPAKIAKRIKQGEGVIADPVSNVSILFTDLHRFSKLFEVLGAEEVVFLLDELVDAFDDLVDKYGLEKIKTIGDGYMAVCGLSVSRLDSDKRAIDCALEMLAHVRRFNYERGLNLDLRIGINTGDLISGIVGKSRYVYDVWGETVNIAHRLKSACPVGSILVSEYVRDRLSDLYEFEQVEIVEVIDKEPLKAWKLRDNRPAADEREESNNSKIAERNAKTARNNGAAPAKLQQEAGKGAIATANTPNEAVNDTVISSKSTDDSLVKPQNEAE